MQSDFNPIRLKKANAKLGRLLHPIHTPTEPMEESIIVPTVIPWWKKLLRALGF
ncbi:MAG TPA: hypothetical protein PLH07_00220 [Sulfurovum sp.]|jgi:hypothetical protein|nr:hypothetical protein [Sulfurovum sp.]HQS71686.1 hypothetical protein [Sulfurovum sp.]HQS78140.1 hypothetical protein [Sulfurovum sp.]HQT27704.1 hypothetical protein [Sulfurovum sp.]